MEQANFFVAQEFGYFREQGIEFEYRPGQGSGDALKQLLAGNGDVAFVGPEAIFFAADQGGDPIAIYNIYPQSLFVIMAWPDAGIQQPAHLRGKTIGVLSQASGSRYNVLTLLALSGLKETDVTLITTGSNPAPFLERKLDAWSTIATTAMELQRQTSQQFDLLFIRDYLNLPTDVLATTREIYTQRPDMLLRFLRAVRQGTVYMIEHPTEAAEVAVRHAMDIKDPVVAERIIRVFAEASQSETTRTLGLGAFDFSVLQDGARLYLETGLVKTPIAVERYFTNDLVARL
ncbi:MAG TPA: ABC transporter substrate-binding protein [Chloroflexota bacterium]|nr:ABC transporter substrate-binding protein [Chloroflexota bacterium]